MTGQDCPLAVPTQASKSRLFVICGISVQGPCSVPSFKLVLKVVLVEVTLVSVVSALVLEIEVRAAVTAVVVTDAVGVSVSATVSVIVSVGDVDV